MGFGLTPLMHAAKAKNLELSMFLLDKGASIETRTVTGRTVLSFAAQGGLVPVVEALLSSGANPNDTELDGWTPLMYSSSVGVAQALLRKGANFNARTNRGNTVLFVHAEDRNATQIVKLLLEQGADPNAANVKGWTPLMVAASNGSVKTVQALLEGGASRSAKNHVGETALDLARKEKIEAVIEVLITGKGAASPPPRR